MLSDDQIRLIVALLISIPISFPIRYLPSKLIRSLYSLIIGTALQYYVYGSDIWLTFTQHILIYLIIFIKGRKCGGLVTFYSMITLFGYHIYRMIIDYGGWTLDVSTIMMTMVCKYSLFAYAYQDGATKAQQLKPQQLNNRLYKLPSFFDYLGYCQFAPTAITGTAFQYLDYQKFMTLDPAYQNIKPNFKLIGWTFCQSIFYVAFYLLGVIYFPMPYMKELQFSQRTFWYICFYSYWSVTLLRFKYYFGWKLSMCSIHASTVSYCDKSKKFDKINTCNPQIVQTSIHMRDRIANWNISCQQWLRKCVYQRVGFKDKAKSALATFMVSAFWHGTYTGYYVSFFFWFAQTHLSTLVYKQSKKQKSPWKTLYKLLGPLGYPLLWMITSFLMTNDGVYFQVLQGKVCLNILNSLYWSPPIVIFLSIGLFTFIRGKSQKKPTIPKQVPPQPPKGIKSLDIQKERQQQDADVYKQL